MSKFDWERKGPPRPGSGAIGHPPNMERPYTPPKTDLDRKREKKELAVEAAKRKAALAPERARQLRRDIRKMLKTGDGTTPAVRFLERIAAIPKPPRKKS